MAHPHTQPMLPGWSPLSQPTPPPTIESLRRWLWPGTVLAAFAALAAYVVETSPGPGISTRGLITLALAVTVLAVLTLRRRWGPLAMLRTLAEYAVVAALAGLLVLAAAPPAERPATERRPAETEQAATLPPVIRQVVGAAGWLHELWQRAGRQADHRTPPPSTTRPTPTGEAMAASPRSPLRLPPPTWRSHP
jgi:hypothetical protein